MIHETQLNEIGGIIHDNLYILPEFIRVITSGNVYFNNLHPLPMDKSHYEKLYDLDLLNELFSYYYQIRKMNNDMLTMTTGYSEIKNAFIQKHINPADYKINTAILADNLKTHEMFMTELQQDTVKLLARIRIQIKHRVEYYCKLNYFLKYCKYGNGEHEPFT